MEKYIIDEHTGWEYELIGEQYYPTGRIMQNGKLQPKTIDKDTETTEEFGIGIWGQRHLQFIRHHKKSLYFDLYVSGKLNSYLNEINTQAEDIFIRLIKETALQEGVTEALKAENQMEWVQRANNIRNCITEIVNQE